ncbi:uncharacterized protein LOC108475235 [Gossypium arboreum]|uniref:uncharacterized protein LOC108475235 n=1 Tax=Gossypium arboreum TaxID=29729 RepID=UPI0008190959|nr:uncharacterized protein LOC108475235 [Gossypium arboreum]
MVLFSSNIPREQRHNFSVILGMKVVEKLDNYIGLPLPIGKKKIVAFQEIINNMSCKLNSWTKRLLSFGGKEVFIKAVLQSIPTYALSIFKAPRGVLDDIQSKLSRAWWTGKEKGRFWAMVPWKTLCHPKGMGGIGIRDIRLFNLALLGRQVWRLVSNKDTLCFKVLSTKYFPDNNIFHSKKTEKVSFTRNSIVATENILKDGFGWQVGNGNKINIREDNWGIEGLNGGTFNMDMTDPNDSSVVDLWIKEQKSWNRDKIYKMYWQDWGDKIYNLPIGRIDHDDRIIWFHNCMAVTPQSLLTSGCC